MSTVSTHVLDAVSGTPATGVAVSLRTVGTTGSDALASAATDADGRIAALAGNLDPGRYELRFKTAAYFASRDVSAFYPEVVIVFEVTDAGAHYHVPLLLSPYAYSTYRGS